MHVCNETNQKIKMKIFEVTHSLLAGLKSTGRGLCHESKLTVLSMRGGYLATELARDTSCCVGSLNNSGNTVKECKGHSGLKSQSANIWGMRFEECRPRLWTHGVSLPILPCERKRELR